MIIVTHDYKSVRHAEMTDNFIIRADKVLQVWDVDERKIALTFISSYDKYTYQITVEKTSEQFLAKDLLNAIKLDISDLIIEGRIKIK